MSQLILAWTLAKKTWIRFEDYVLENMGLVENQRVMLCATMLDLTEQQVFELAWRRCQPVVASYAAADAAYLDYLHGDELPEWVESFIDDTLQRLDQGTLAA